MCRKIKSSTNMFINFDVTQGNYKAQPNLPSNNDVDQIVVKSVAYYCVEAKMSDVVLSLNTNIIDAPNIVTFTPNVVFSIAGVTEKFYQVYNSYNEVTYNIKNKVPTQINFQLINLMNNNIYTEGRFSMILEFIKFED